jgi:hypothetical protein
MNGIATTAQHEPASRGRRRMTRALPGPAVWGVVAGAIQAASPLAFWWLEPKTVYALGLTLIAAVYIGFSVADGRGRVIAAESIVPSRGRDRRPRPGVVAAAAPGRTGLAATGLEVR